MSVNSVQLLRHVRLSATPWTAARQSSLSITNSRTLLKLMSIKSVMPSNYLILNAINDQGRGIARMGTLTMRSSRAGLSSFLGSHAPAFQ